MTHPLRNGPHVNVIAYHAESGGPVLDDGHVDEAGKV
jgi:hypothetical protein